MGTELLVEISNKEILEDGRLYLDFKYVLGAVNTYRCGEPTIDILMGHTIWENAFGKDTSYTVEKFDKAIQNYIEKATSEQSFDYVTTLRTQQLDIDALYISYPEFADAYAIYLQLKADYPISLLQNPLTLELAYLIWRTYSISNSELWMNFDSKLLSDAFTYYLDIVK